MGEQTMTLVEYATVRADECTCNIPRQDHITGDVDMMISTASTLGKSLWQVGIDAEGRVSLIWSSHPREAWDALHSESIRMEAAKQAVTKMLGLSL